MHRPDDTCPVNRISRDTYQAYCARRDSLAENAGQLPFVPPAGLRGVEARYDRNAKNQELKQATICHETLAIH